MSSKKYFPRYITQNELWRNWLERMGKKALCKQIKNLADSPNSEKDVDYLIQCLNKPYACMRAARYAASVVMDPGFDCGADLKKFKPIISPHTEIINIFSPEDLRILQDKLDGECELQIIYNSRENVWLGRVYVPEEHAEYEDSLCYGALDCVASYLCDFCIKLFADLIDEDQEEIVDSMD